MFVAVPSEKMSAKNTYTLCIVSFILGSTLFGFLSYAGAWTAPGNTPPNGNVAAPVNVGVNDQIKSAGLGVNSLAVYGNAILNGASRYLNFGTTAGSSGYGIRDNAGVIEFKNSGGTWQNRNTFTGNVTADGYFHSSDMNLKTNIEQVSGLDVVSRLRGVSFFWRESNKPSAGVIAQEVEDVLPEIVRTDAQGLKSVDYDALIPFLIEAIKEQQREIDYLRQRVEDTH